MAQKRKVKQSRKGRFNTIINGVPQGEIWVVERMGKFHKILKPGVAVLLPFVDSIKYVHSSKERTIEIPQQEAITLDKVPLVLDAALHIRVVDPYKASYGRQDPESAISQYAITVMHEEVGKLMLENVLRIRDNLNLVIVERVNEASEPWGIACVRFEIFAMNLSPGLQQAMALQAEAERKNRALMLEIEGARQAELYKAETETQIKILKFGAETQCHINMAKAKAEAAQSEKIQKILDSEAAKQAEINRAQGQAVAIGFVTDALCKASDQVVSTFDKKGANADNSIKAFGQIAKSINAVIVPSNPADVAAVVTQAMDVSK